jgi:GNAT superfamily N-acetyltransferase
MIRLLDPDTDREAVSAMLAQAQDYYQLWKGHAPGPAETDEFLIDPPQRGDPASKLPFGYFVDDTLCGVAEVFFGFPEPDDAYLGLMMLAAAHRSQGHGARLLTRIEAECRDRGARLLYLAVLEANPRGAAFWARMRFSQTGVSRIDTDTAAAHRLHRLVKPL